VVVAFGEGVAWRSANGTEWRRVSDPSARPVAAGVTRLLSLEDRVVAFVTPRNARAVEVWQTTSDTAWKKIAWARVAELPSSRDVRIGLVARGARGWVATGQTEQGVAVWTSSNGTRWQRTTDTSAFKDASVSYVIALDAGFVAVGFSGEEPGTTCGTGEPLVGHTWTSTDGRTWREMPHEKQFDNAMLLALYARNDTLFTVGGYWNSGNSDGPAVWTAKLPATAANASRAASYRAPAPPGGCGP
jgi:hypothetical protein